jgi:hypothetical protein
LRLGRNQEVLATHHPSLSPDPPIPKLYSWALRETWDEVRKSGLISAIDNSMIFMHGDISIFTSHLPQIKEVIEGFLPDTVEDA